MSGTDETATLLTCHESERNAIRVQLIGTEPSRDLLGGRQGLDGTRLVAVALGHRRKRGLEIGIRHATH